MNFFEQMIAAICKFRQYPRLMTLNAGRVAGYLIIFTLLITVIGQVPFMIGYKQLGGITGAIETYVPDFSLSNGKLRCESIDYNDEMASAKIYIDVNDDVSNMNVDDYATYMLVDSDKMIIKNGIQKRIVEFSQFKDESFDKSTLVNFFASPKIELAILIIYLISIIIGITVGTLFMLFLLSALALLINSMFIHADLGFSDMLKLTIYAKTFPNILVLLLGLAGMSSLIVYWGLLLTYIYIGLKNIKQQEAIILARL